jgi:hypothetical protein
LAYYTALINAWNAASAATGAALPSGVTGSLLTGMTTAQKIAAVNAWTVTGPAIPAYIPVEDIKSVIVPSEFLSLTTLKIQQLQFILQGSEMIYAPVGGLARGVIGNVFASGPNTLAALTALAAKYDTPKIPWVTAPLTNNPSGAGLSTPVSMNDAINAGLT